jgi:hypothetical protein
MTVIITLGQKVYMKEKCVPDEMGHEARGRSQLRTAAESRLEGKA